MKIFNAVAAVILLGLVAFFAGLFAWGRNLPSVTDLDVLELGGKTAVYDRAAQPLGTLDPSLTSGSHVNRDLLKLNQISPELQAAVVTSEDRRFYQHGAIDVQGLLRGLFRSAAGNTQGGSTITQQVVKNTLLADMKDQRTLPRKFREALLAFQVERRFSKQEILTAYLNVVYWGAGQYRDAARSGTNLIGAQAAAQAYFRTDARHLTLAQSAYLATLLPNPRRYFYFKDYRPLMHDLLDRMVEDGRVTRAQADAAWRERLEPAGWNVRYDGRGNVVSATRLDGEYRSVPAPYVRFGDSYLDEVDRQAAALVGRRALYGGGVKVYTYLDRTTQAAAERASRDARIPAGATMGMAFLDPRSGQVLALVGQKLGDGVLEEWNNATRARRQVGSSIKPLLYTTALANGWQQSDTVLDAPLDGNYQPKNYDGRWTGRPVTLRYALDHSLNLPTVRLAQQLGLSKFESRLTNLGLDVPDGAGLPLAIGTLQASPLQMAAAYAPFAANGQYRDPRLISKIVGEGGKVLYQEPASQARQVWDAQTAWLGLDMIRGVVNDLTPAEGGLGWRARIDGWAVGGKTGTTNDVKDLWFVGVTPVLSGAVWVGRADNRAMPQNAYSGDVAVPVWQQTAQAALADRRPVDFQAPGGIEYATVRGVRMAFKPQQGGVLSGLFGGRQSAPPTPSEPEPAAAPPADQGQTDPTAQPDATLQDPAPQDQTQADPSDALPDASDPQDQTQADPADQAPTEALPQPEDLQPAPQDQTQADPNAGTPDTDASDPTTTDPSSTQDQTQTDPSTADPTFTDPAASDPADTDPSAQPDPTTTDSGAQTDPSGDQPGALAPYDSDPSAQVPQDDGQGSISVTPLPPAQ